MHWVDRNRALRRTESANGYDLPNRCSTMPLPQTSWQNDAALAQNARDLSRRLTAVLADGASAVSAGARGRFPRLTAGDTPAPSTRPPTPTLKDVIAARRPARLILPSEPV